MGNMGQPTQENRINQEESTMRVRSGDNGTKPRLLVSFTSWPARIRFVPSMLETIYRQTLPADEVVLWLSEEEFPEKEKELPPELLEYAAEGRLSIHWCTENLKSHKKYFYACQEWPDDIIVTVDDDLLYPSELLQNLYDSYLRYPDAISAARVHLIPVTEEGEILPYRLWLREPDYTIGIPSLFLFATSGAGTLFPPHILPPETFDLQAIMDNCLLSDDLWLKTMQLYADVPVVLVTKHPGIQCIEGSQEIRLYELNQTPTGNDLQLANIREWTRNTFGTDLWKDKLLHPTTGAKLYGVESICAHAVRQVDKFSGIARKKTQANRELNAKLQQVYQENSKLNAKLQQAYWKQSELNEKLRQNRKENSELNAKLQQTYKEKSERGEKIKEMESHFLVKVDRKLHKIWNHIFRRSKGE